MERTDFFILIPGNAPFWSKFLQYRFSSQNSLIGLNQQNNLVMGHCFQSCFWTCEGHYDEFFYFFLLHVCRYLTCQSNIILKLHSRIFANTKRQNNKFMFIPKSNDLLHTFKLFLNVLQTFAKKQLKTDLQSY